MSAPGVRSSAQRLRPSTFCVMSVKRALGASCLRMLGTASVASARCAVLGWAFAALCGGSEFGGGAGAKGGVVYYSRLSTHVIELPDSAWVIIEGFWRSEFHSIV